MTAVLALAASAFWGASDFMGGAVSRRRVRRSTSSSSRRPWPSSSWASPRWPPARTTSRRRTSRGPSLPASSACCRSARSTRRWPRARWASSRRSPPAASIVPLVVGVAEGNRLGGLQVAGIALAVVGVVAASGPDLRERSQRDRTTDRPRGARRCRLRRRRRLHRPGQPYLGRHVAAHPAADLGRLPGGRRAGPAPAAQGRPYGPAGARRASGCSTSAANAAYASSTTGGALSLVAVLASLYPAVTVLLARQLHAERLALGPGRRARRRQSSARCSSPPEAPARTLGQPGQSRSASWPSGRSGEAADTADLSQ